MTHDGLWYIARNGAQAHCLMSSWSPCEILAEQVPGDVVDDKLVFIHS